MLYSSSVGGSKAMWNNEDMIRWVIVYDAFLLTYIQHYVIDNDINVLEHVKHLNIDV